MQRSRFAAIAIGGLLIAATAASEPQYFSQRDLQSVVSALDVVDLQGQRWTAANLKGRIVLIDFWATWCAPCLAQIPEFKRLRETWPRDQFEVLSISVDSLPRRDFVAWLNRHGVAWPQVHDGRAFNSPAARPFGIGALPASLLVSNGTIAGENLRGARLVEAINHLRGVQRVSTSSFDAARVPIVIR